MQPKLIHAKATAGIYAEVMKQIYDSLDKRIREAVSNAIDAHATKVKISVYTADEGKMIIFDNGYGMEEKDIVEKFVAMGGGDNYNDTETIGRIGIGALSIFAIGSKIVVHTRKKGDKNIVTTELDFEKIQSASYHSTPLDEIIVGEIKASRPATSGDEDHFTEIVIDNLSRPVRVIFSDAAKTKDLIERLEKILPVPYRDDDFTVKKLPGELEKELVTQRFQIKDVSLHVPELGYSNPDYQIYRKSIEAVDAARIIHYQPIFPFKLDGGVDSKLSVFGYLFINDGKALPRNWQGINARVKNVTIESNTYFGYEDDPASRNRVGGEVYITYIDENHAITTNRSGFAVENGDYALVSKYLKDRIKIATDIVRRHSEIDSTVKKYVSSLDRLRQVFETDALIQDAHLDNNLFKDLDDKTVRLNIERKFSLEDILTNELSQKKVRCEIIWSSVLSENYAITPDEDQFYSIQIHSKLREFKFNVAGNSIEYVVAYCGEETPLLVKKPGKIYLNLDNTLFPNQDINKVEYGFVGTILTLYLNFLRCNGSANDLFNWTTNDLKETL